MSKRVNSYEGRAEMSGKPPIPQLPPRQKQRRPNQRPPQRRASAPGSLPGSSDGEEHGGEEPIDNEPYDSDGEAVGPSSSFVDWGERQKRRNEALRKQLGDLKECYLLNLPLATRFFELDQQHQINQHQSRLDCAWQLWGFLLLPCPSDDTPLSSRSSAFSCSAWVGVIIRSSEHLSLSVLNLAASLPDAFFLASLIAAMVKGAPVSVGSVIVV